MEEEGSWAWFSARLTFSPGTQLHRTEPRNQNKVTPFSSINMVREKMGPLLLNRRWGILVGKGGLITPHLTRSLVERMHSLGEEHYGGWEWTWAHTHTPPYSSCVTRGKA